MLTRIATATHFLLHLFIFGMPIIGALAWYFDLGAMGRFMSSRSRSSSLSDSTPLRHCGSISS